MTRGELNKALESLKEKGLMVQHPDGTWEPTALGRAAVVIEDENDRIQAESRPTTGDNQ